MVFSVVTLTALFWCLGLFPLSVSAGTVAAWTNQWGAPQVMVQDDDTGKILYSFCNSNETTIFPGNGSRALEFDKGLEPKKGTSIAGVGFVDPNSNITAAMWFLNDDDVIVHALWHCNSTGHFVNSAEGSSSQQWIIHNMGSVHPNTGLAAVDLPGGNGYRVYYQQEDLTTSTLEYTQETGWVMGGNISQDPIKGFSISAGFINGNDITVITPRDNKNIEVSTLLPNQTWIISTFPTPLEPVSRDNPPVKQWLAPTNGTNSSSFSLDYFDASPDVLGAWDGRAKSIGLTLDSDATRRIFYIGSDSLLYCQFESESESETLDDGPAWSVCTDTDSSLWPAADSANAAFASAFDASRNAIWIFYMSGGNLTQVHRSSRNKWEEPIALPTSPIDHPPELGGDDGGSLSRSAKIGIGVGVGIGGLLLLGFVTYICVQRRRGKQEKRESADADANTEALASQPGTVFLQPSPAPAYASGVPGGRWADGEWVVDSGNDNDNNNSKAVGQWQQERASYQPVPTSPPLPDLTQNLNQGQDQIHEMPNEVRYHEMPVETNKVDGAEI